MSIGNESARRGILASAVAAALVLGGGPAAAGELEIDLQHSTISFKVRHLFTNVQGRFNDFSGSIAIDEENLAASSVQASIKVESIDTNVEGRDEDLRSERFFDVAKYPSIEFESSEIADVSGKAGRIVGTLTMHGVSREVVLVAEFLGSGKDPWGNVRYGFTASTTVNRKDYGMTWNEVVEAGGVLVGEEIEIQLDIEATPKSE